MIELSLIKFFYTKRRFFMQDIVTKAKELGIMLRDSKEMANFKRTEVDFQNDLKAEELFEEYKQLQVEMVRVTKGDSGNEIIEEVKERLLAKHKEINEYDITRNYLEAKASLDAFMRQVNDVIMYTVSGEESCSSGSCSSCSGCH